MDHTKNIAKSKTMIGAVLVFLAMLAPVLGFEFSADEAETLTQKFAAFLDNAAEIVGLVLIVWGRLTADKKLTVLPNSVNSPWPIAIMAAMIALSGCVGGATYTDKTPVEKLRASYDAALPLITIYLALPACGPEVVGLCSKPEVSKLLSDGSTTVETYLAQLEATEGLSDEERADAIRAANNALRTLLTIYAVQALTRA